MSTSTSVSCSGSDSFRIAGFQLDAYDGCYSASQTTTFNFLPVFYIGGVPADGPAVYASDLFGSLTDEYVWAIGEYDQRRDVIDRYCNDDGGSDASTVHPSEVADWACGGDLASTFAVTCGCSATPAPAGPETAEPTPAPSALPSPPGARSTRAPAAATGATPVPTTAAVVTPTPTASPAGASASPAAATAEPSPAAAPEASETTAPGGTAAPAGASAPPGGAGTPSPLAGSRGASPVPSFAPAVVDHNNTTSPVCSGDDSFRVESFRLGGAYDGCYSASNVSTFNFLPVFYIGGVPADGPVVYASDLFASLANETYVWAIGNYNSTQDTVDTRLCQDEDGTDAASTHPAEVAAWLCDGSGSTTTATAEDDDYTGFTVWCGCTTPAPTGTDGLRDFTLSPAPIALAAEEVEDISEDDGMPTPVIIVTAFAVFAVVAIVLSIAFEGLRKGLWLCISGKRESTPEDSGGSSSVSSSRGQAA